jgi:outer membrane protein OmpA-like peptidoglycan-associated protein
MKNRLIATIAVSALAIGVSAAAHADAHPYAGINGGYFHGNDEMTDGYNTEGTAGLDVGYHFDKDWSIEASQSEGIATRKSHIRNYSLTTAYRLLGEETQLLAIGGIQNNNWDVTDVVPVIGLGVSHYFTDNVELRGTMVGSINGAEYTASMLALNYHFGTHAEKDVAEPAPEKVAPAVVMTKTLHAHFSTDKSEVRADDKVEITAVADSMKQNPGSTATVVGHTDSTASEAYNQALSERRAEAVKAVMVDQGVNPDAIETSGRGESEPVGDNATAEGRQENRRIEAVVTGLPE